jgi:MFS family permease
MHNNPGVTAQPWPRPTVAWYAVAILVVAFIFSFIDRIIIGLLVDPIKADLGLSDTQMGLLLGFAFAIFYALLGLPIGRWADRYSRRMIIGVGIFLWSLMTVLCGLARNYFQLFAARVGVAVGEAALSPAAYSMIADMFPREKLGRALGVYQSGAMFGAGLAFLVGGIVIGFASRPGGIDLPLLGVLEPWRTVFVLVGVPGCLVALLMATIEEPVRRGRVLADEVHLGWADARAWLAVHRPGVLKALAIVAALDLLVLLATGPLGLLVALGVQVVSVLALWFLRDALPFTTSNWRLYVGHFVGFSLLMVPFTTMATWGPSYMIRVLGYAPPEAGLRLGILLLVLCPLAVVTGGWSADLLGRRGYRDAPLRIGIAAAGVMLPLSLVTWLVATPEVAMLLLVPFLFFASISNALAPAALQLVTPGPLRAQVSAVWMLVLNLVTAGLGPTLVGLVTDRLFGNPLAVGQSMALINALCMPVAALALWFCMRPFRTAASRMES